MSDEKVLVDRASLLKLCKLVIAWAGTYQPTTVIEVMLRQELVAIAENIRGPIDIAGAGSLIPKKFRRMHKK